MPFPQTVHFVFLSFGCDPGEHLAHSPVVPALPGGQSSQVLWSMCGCLPAAQAVHVTPSVPANTAASQEKPPTVGRKTGGSVAPCCSAGHGSQPMGPTLLPSASGSGLRQTEVSYRSLACEGALGAHLACAGIWPAAHTEHTPFPSCVVAFPSEQATQDCLSCDGSFPSTHSTQVPSS